MSLFQDKYRIESARLQSWDYGNNAPYFVTICTHQHLQQFGKITDDVCHLSDLGKAANKCWADIPVHFPFVELDEFVVMPNHIHGIIVINKQLGLSLDPTSQQNAAGNKFGAQSQSLGAIVRGFKIGVTNFARQNNIEFKWQPRFHDHVIRTEESFNRIRNYVFSNVENWQKDKFYRS